MNMKKMPWMSLGALALAVAAVAPPARAAKIRGSDRDRRAPCLDSVRDGVQAALKAGFEASKNLQWQYQSAQGNTGTAAQIAHKFIGDKAECHRGHCPHHRPSTSIAATKTVPVVFSAVTDPVAAKLVKNWEPSHTNVTGVSDLLALDKQMDLVKQENGAGATRGRGLQPWRGQLGRRSQTIADAAAPGWG